MKIFIGSSSEGRGVMCQVAQWIEACEHEPLPWDTPGLFRAGQYTFQTVLQIAKEVDAALFVLTEDDTSWFRGSHVELSRDNVLIEYGLFAGILDPDCVAAVRSGNPKTPSELAGISYIDAQTPAKARLEVEAWLASLSSKRSAPRENGSTDPSSGSKVATASTVSAVHEVASDVGSRILDEMKEKRPIEIHNLALDCEVIQSWIDFSIVSNSAVRDVTYKCLLIDPESEMIARLVDNEGRSGKIALNIDAARSMIRKVRSLADNEDLAQRNVKIELRAYSIPPILHGFYVNGRNLYVSVTHLIDNEIVGGNVPYLKVVPSDQDALSELWRTSFKSWFDYLWSHSRDTLEIPSKRDSPRRTRVFGHRGSPAHAPENSIEAIQDACRMGVDGVEIDVRLTKDGIPVVLHDASLARTSDCKRRLTELTAEDLRRDVRLNNGEPIPTLREACRAVMLHDGVELMVELKQYGGWREVAEVVREELPRDRAMIGCFDHGTLRDIKLSFPEVRTVAILSGSPLYQGDSLRDTMCEAASLDWSTLSQEQVKRVSALGLTVFSWTIDDPEQARLASDMGIDGIITNRPDQIMEALAEPTDQEPTRPLEEPPRESGATEET